MELVYNKSKPVAVTGMAFPTGDVNNFVVGSEEGTVYTACRHGRWFSVFLPMTCSSFPKVCYHFLDYNHLALWERHFGRNAKHSLKSSFSCRSICSGHYPFVNLYSWGKMSKLLSISYETLDYLPLPSLSLQVSAVDPSVITIPKYCLSHHTSMSLYIWFLLLGLVFLASWPG